MFSCLPDRTNLTNFVNTYTHVFFFYFVISVNTMDSLTGQQLLAKDETVVQADEVLSDKKIIAFYFSAHWCPPCRLFTPVLAEFYSVSLFVFNLLN